MSSFLTSISNGGLALDASKNTVAGCSTDFRAPRHPLGLLSLLELLQLQLSSLGVETILHCLSFVAGQLQGGEGGCGGCVAGERGKGRLAANEDVEGGFEGFGEDLAEWEGAEGRR